MTAAVPPANPRNNPTASSGPNAPTSAPAAPPSSAPSSTPLSSSVPATIPRAGDFAGRVVGSLESLGFIALEGIVHGMPATTPHKRQGPRSARVLRGASRGWTLPGGGSATVAHFPSL